MAVNHYQNEHGLPINKFDLNNQNDIYYVEYALTSRRMAEILTEDVLSAWHSYDLAHLQAIHFHLFQDMYDWAGKIRTVYLNKFMANGQLSVFAAPEKIVSGWAKLNTPIHNFIHHHGFTPFQDKINQLSHIFIRANHLHPFPEGNGRSLQIFMQQLARERGVWLDYRRTEAAEWNRACALSGVYGDLVETKGGRRLIRQPTNRAPIEQIFREIAEPLQ